MIVWLVYDTHIHDSLIEIIGYRLFKIEFSFKNIILILRHSKIQ